MSEIVDCFKGTQSPEGLRFDFCFDPESLWIYYPAQQTLLLNLEQALTAYNNYKKTGRMETCQGYVSNYTAVA
jgi:hypothetical protein